MFTPEECKKIIDLSGELTVRSTNGEYGDYGGINFTNWDIREDDNTKWIYDRMLEKFTKHTGLKIIERPVGIGLMKYSEGDQFERHHDCNTFQNRIWNIGVLLNDDYEGGDFILYEPEYIIPKTPGQIYVFESHREHEVKKITKGIRWSLILFIWSKHVHIKHLL